MAFFQLHSRARTAFLTYLKIASLFLIAYSALNYILFLRPGYSTVREDWQEIWLPMILPVIPLWIWLRPKLKQLHFRNRKGDPVFGLLILSTFAVAVPTMIAQGYLNAATGTLSRLHSINEIKTQPPSRYYSVSQYSIDKGHPGLFYLIATSGKAQQYLDLDLYIACPVYNDPVSVPAAADADTVKNNRMRESNGPLYILDGRVSDSATVAAIPKDVIASVRVFKGPDAVSMFGARGAKGVVLTFTKHRPGDTKIDAAAPLPVPPAWICVKYHKQISNRDPATQKQQRIRAFSLESMKDFNRRRLDGFTYLSRLGNNTRRDQYLKAVSNSWPAVDPQTVVLLEPSYMPFSDRNGNRLPWIFGSFAIGALILWVILRASTRAFSPENALTQPEGSERLRQSIAFWLPHEGFYATPWIIFLNILVFALMVISGMGFLHFETPELLRWGANSRIITMHGQWWRLITCAFLHGGFMHLALNMYGLLFAGVFLEPVLGTKRFAILYLICAVIASLASIAWYRAVVSVGASGAIFGMYGVFVALLIANLFHASIKKSFLINLVVFIGINLLYGLTGGTDNAAHIGGLTSGLIAGFLIAPLLKRERAVKEEMELAGDSPDHF